MLMNVIFTDISWEKVRNKATDRNLTQNDKKTNYTTFSINEASTNFNTIILQNSSDGLVCYQLNCKSIKAMTRIRYRGIILDNHLRWNLHSHNLVGKLRSLTYTFIYKTSVFTTFTHETQKGQNGKNRFLDL